MMTTIGSTMRHFIQVFLLGTFLPGFAGATSVEVLERRDDAATPSILYYGAAEGSGPAAPDVIFEPSIPLALPSPEIAAADEPVALSPSVVALGEPAVEEGLVASIRGDARPRNPHLPPMVIRGGIFGDPFSRPAQESPPAQAATTPQPGQPVAPAMQAQPPEPASPPPPAPTRRVK